MIPKFPEFKSLEITDRKEIIGYTSKFLPYSDFNFTSMWSWDIGNGFRISLLNDNLVVMFIDYISGEPFLSFLGTNEVLGTISTLLNYAKDAGIDSTLRLLPEDVIKEVSDQQVEFQIDEDRDGFDYILSVEKIDGFKGNKLRGKRNFMNRCERMYLPEIKILDTQDSQIKLEILSITKDWMDERGATGEDPNLKELSAIDKLLNGGHIPNITIIGLYIQDKMKGFVIGEDLRNGYAMLHFEKVASVSLVGAYAYLMHSFAVVFRNKGCESINYEQDLGIEGLRKHKESLLPTFAKKDSIKIK